MRTYLFLAALAIAPITSQPALAQFAPPIFVPPRVEDPVYDWVQEFPVTPAFADWTRVGELTSDGVVPVGEMWLHRDSFRWHESRGRPFLWADVLMRLDAGGYSRRQFMLSCDATRIFTTHAAGFVTIDANGAIRPASALTGINGYNVSPTALDAWYDLFCFDREFQARFIAR
jgi:hypothetical protein